MVSDRGVGNARLVELQPGRPGPSVFLIPGSGGRVDGFSELARLLDTAMPIVGIEARGVDSTVDWDHDLETLVQHYIERIRNVQPNGPYFLVGYSFGGAIAFEMAQRILAMHERVACLVLLDTMLPTRYWPRRFYLAKLGARMYGHLERIMNGSIADSINYYTWRLGRRWQGLHDVPAELTFGRESARMLMAVHMLLEQWRPEFYPGRVTLFCAADSKLWTLYESRVAELETHIFAGEHTNLLDEPYVSSVAIDVSACLTKAS